MNRPLAALLFAAIATLPTALAQDGPTADSLLGSALPAADPAAQPIDCVITSIFAADVLAFLEEAGVAAVLADPTTVLASDVDPMDGPLGAIPVPSATTCLDLRAPASSVSSENRYGCQTPTGTIATTLPKVCSRAESYMAFASYPSCGVSSSTTHWCLSVTQKGFGEAQLTTAKAELYPDPDVGSYYPCNVPLATSLLSCGKTYAVHYALHLKTLPAEHVMETDTTATGTTALLFVFGPTAVTTATARYTP